MKRWLTLGLLLGAAPLIWAQEARTWTPEPFVLIPYGRIQTSVTGVVGQESRAIAIGDGRTALGIYVYDPQGNCVAFDDEPIARYFDDRIAGWSPTVSGMHEVQIRNLGPGFNRVEASAK